MENQTKRMLAYQLAKNLPYHELDDASGGFSQTCLKPSGKVTGDSAQGPIASFDVTIDF